MNSQKFGGYRELKVWQKSIDLVVRVYEATKKYPQDEMYGLVSQTRRAVVSIPSNVAEGQSRATIKDFIHFLRIAYASGAEIETQLIIAEKIGYLSEKEKEDILHELHEVVSMIVGLIKALQKTNTLNSKL